MKDIHHCRLFAQQCATTPPLVSPRSKKAAYSLGLLADIRQLPPPLQIISITLITVRFLGFLPVTLREAEQRRYPLLWDIIHKTAYRPGLCAQSADPSGEPTTTFPHTFKPIALPQLAWPYTVYSSVALHQRPASTRLTTGTARPENSSFRPWVRRVSCTRSSPS